MFRPSARIWRSGHEHSPFLERTLETHRMTLSILDLEPSGRSGLVEFLVEGDEGMFDPHSPEDRDLLSVDDDGDLVCAFHGITL